ncbi:hypothetical protein TcasGA2_TC005816 [Tribolium castaneum]|uniref:Peptidase S1 domain-containing protein n=1 Tax=Tribolium castaneum TaxID=7070 RepID=D6WW48_TRICA|nr:PREDICTED: complement factor D-like [Tribolium castaneum]EFA08189.1 hypothetical protein TcasGA2_TC005816 [Tribolium castaneum]|eukprot:XP_015838221.1 PREDICTED: complement factor D-like [Tribolium castaneum]
MFLRVLLLSFLIVFEAESIKSPDELAALFQEPQNKKIIKNNNGERVPPGYYSYAVIFKLMKEPKSHLFNNSDFFESLAICSGTVLNRRWVVTKASPIAYYKTKLYRVMVQPDGSQASNTYKVESVLLHPNHFPGDITTDVALVRVARDFQFALDLRNANLGFPVMPLNQTACKMPVWSFFFVDNSNSSKIMEKGEISLTVVTTGCHTDFLCLKPNNSKAPCSFNIGMPIICNTVLTAVYFGNETTGGCNGQLPEMVTALRADTPFLEYWFNETGYFDDMSDNITGSAELRRCSGANSPLSGAIIFTFVSIFFSLPP